jgi:hypothetical protein
MYGRFADVRVRYTAPVGSLGLRTVLLTSLLAAGCGGPKVFTRPAPGTGAPAPDADAAWTAATARCASIETVAPTLELTGGRINGQSIPGIRVWGGATRGGSIRLDADHPSQKIFLLNGVAERAQLVLYLDKNGIPQTVTAPAADIIEAIIGLRIDPSTLLAILTGCVGAGEPIARAERFGDRLAVQVTNAVVYLVNNATWRMAGADLPNLRVDFAAATADGPTQIVLVSSGVGSDAAIRLRVRENLINSSDLKPAAFEIVPVANAQPITLEELRKIFQRN